VLDEVLEGDALRGVLRGLQELLKPWTPSKCTTIEWMGRNKDLRKLIAGYRRQLEIHEAKLVEERAKPIPDEGLIGKWQREIKGFERIVAVAEAKLPGKRRK
jgi:hypothetical protein